MVPGIGMFLLCTSLSPLVMCDSMLASIIDHYNYFYNFVSMTTLQAVDTNCNAVLQLISTAYSLAPIILTVILTMFTNKSHVQDIYIWLNVLDDTEWSHKMTVHHEPDVFQCMHAHGKEEGKNYVCTYSQLRLGTSIMGTSIHANRK